MPTTSRPSRRSLCASLIAVVAIASGALPVLATGPGARPDGATAAALTAPTPLGTPRGTITTADGLALTVNTDGTVGEVKDGTRVLPRTPAAGGFSLRMVGGQPNLLTNAGFESGTTGWSFPASGTYRPVVATDQFRTGTRSAKIAITGTTLRTSLAATQTVNVAAGTSYVIGGYSKTSAVIPNSTETTAPLVYKSDQAPARINVQMLDSASVVKRQFWVTSYTGTTDWSRQSMGLKANAGETKLRVRIIVENGAGTVWFDDLSVSPLFAPSSTAMSTTTSLATGQIDQTSTFSGQPLRLEASYRTFLDADDTANGIKIAGKVKHLGGLPADRAFQVTYNLPVNATGWKYADTPRSGRVIANGQTYTFDTGTVMPAARYPWATVHDAASSISLGATLSKPRAFFQKYSSSQGLTITFDLGVSTSATALASEASFEIQLFRAQPKWGFRAAIEKYYQLNDATFARRPEIDPEREGIAFYSPPREEMDPTTTQIDESEELHLGLNVVGLGYNSSWGKPYVTWDEANGRNIYSVAYTHHWGNFLDTSACPDPAPTCTYAEVVAKVNAAAKKVCTVGDTPCERIRDEAIAAKKATAKDLNGRWRYDFEANEYRLRQIPDPALLPDAPKLNWSDTVMEYQLEEARAEAIDAGGTLDGIYIDSTSGMRPVWGNTDDYDRKKWARTTMPLTFSYDSGNVTLKSFFANYLQVKRTSDWAHGQGMIVVLDTNGKEQTPGGILATDLADWLLVENSLRDLEFPNASALITPDSYAMLKRVLAYQRPIVTVDPKLADGSLSAAPTTDLIADSVVSRVNHSLFYGIWPGPEKFDSGDPTAWWKSQAYKDIYGAYGKLLRLMAGSGWEPVTYATASVADLWLERYGKASDDDLLIAVRNETLSPLTNVTVTVQLDKDGLAAVEPGTTATQKVLGQGIGFNPDSFTLNADRTQATFVVSVPARTTGLVKIKRPLP